MDCTHSINKLQKVVKIWGEKTDRTKNKTPMHVWRIHISNVSDCISVSSLSDGDLDTEKRRWWFRGSIFLLVADGKTTEKLHAGASRRYARCPLRHTACTTRGAAVSPTPGEVSMAAKSMGLFGWWPATQLAAQVKISAPDDWKSPVTTSTKWERRN